MKLYFTSNIKKIYDLYSKKIPFFFTRYQKPLLESFYRDNCSQHVIGRRFKGSLSKFDGSFIDLEIRKSFSRIDRDSYGAVPIYFSNNQKIVTTELDIIIKFLSPNHKAIDLNSLSEYLSSSYITGGKTLYKDIKWLMPNQILFFKNDKFIIKEKKIFSSLNLYDEKKVKKYLNKSIDNSISDFIKRFPGPVMINLSGGTDSTLLLAKIRELQPNKKIFSTTYFHSDWRKDLNDWEFAKLASKKFKSKHKLINITNQKFSNCHIDYIKKIKHVSHTFATSFYFQNKNNLKLPILNGSGPDESIVGSEKMSINDLLTYRNLPKKLWKKKLIKEIDYLKLSEEDVKLYLLKKHKDKVSFKSSRMQIASKVIDAKNFVEFQRQYHAMTILQDHILEISQVSSILNQPVIFPYLTQDIFKIIFSTPFEILNKNGVYKSILKNILENYIDKSFIHRKKIGFQAPSRPYFAEKKGLGRNMKKLLKSNKTSFFDLDYLKSGIRDRIENDSSNLLKRYDFLEWTSYNVLVLESKIFKK